MIEISIAQQMLWPNLKVLIVLCIFASILSMSYYLELSASFEEPLPQFNQTVKQQAANSSVHSSIELVMKPIVPKPRAIVTYLAQEDSALTFNTRYLQSVRLMIRTIKDELKKSNTSDLEIVVMVIKETCLKTREILKGEGFVVREIDSLSLLPKKRQGTRNKYRHQFGKLFLWSFVEYSEVLFLDADIFIRDDILPLFDEVDRDAFDVAGVIDFGMNFPSNPNVIPRPGYINGGLFWLKPSITRFNHMVSKLDDTEIWKSYWDLFEQDYLNWYFGKTIQLLDAKWNRQLLCDEGLRWLSNQPKQIYETTVAWHVKSWNEWDDYITYEWQSYLDRYEL